MAWHANTSALTSFSFYKDTDQVEDIGFLKTLKNPIYLKIILMTLGIIYSLKFKTKRMVKLWNY